MEKKDGVLRLKVFDADNGVVIVDKSVLSVEVVPFGEGGEEAREDIHKTIGMAIYEEWVEMRKKDMYEIFGVEIEVRYKPIKKDVLF